MSKKIDAAKIADLAGVSRATVSRVINNYQFVKPETRERVLKVIADNNYTPNFSAQILAGKSPNTIGLFIYTMEDRYSLNSLEDFHINILIHRISQKANLAGYFVLIYMLNDVKDINEQSRIKDMFLHSRIDAGIFIGFADKCNFIDDLAAKGFTIGVLGQSVSKNNQPNRIIVNFDNSSIISVVDYAVRLGHRDISIMNSRIWENSGSDIFTYFKMAMQHRGIKVKKNFLIKPDSFTKEGAEKAITELIQSNSQMPSLIICGSDIMAFGVIEALKKWGYMVPEDISVIGYYDNIISEFFNPPLTTMRFDFEEIISILVDKVIEHIGEPLKKQFIFSSSPQLIIRKSSRPAPVKNNLL